eukprot:1161685-Pelagomonas_calceolata.AAC.12
MHCASHQQARSWHTLANHCARKGTIDNVQAQALNMLCWPSHAKRSSSLLHQTLPRDWVKATYYYMKLAYSGKPSRMRELRTSGQH